MVDGEDDGRANHATGVECRLAEQAKMERLFDDDSKREAR